MRLAANLPRTVLSASNAAESPTALLARREMQAWRLLQLEPAALRHPDNFQAPTQLGMDGSHMAAALYHLARVDPLRKCNGVPANERAEYIYGQVASRLADLIDDVQRVWIDRDDQRDLLTLHVTGHDNTVHPARSLSDGTLRFLALTVLELDPEARGLLCLEEPENGIHPSRIPAMLDRLQNIATDADEPVGPDNPLRQVIINTHSPTVVGQVPDDSLLVAELKETVHANRRFKRACFSCLPDTWRTKAPESVSIVSKGKLLAYLNPIALTDTETEERGMRQSVPRLSRRVVDRPDMQLLLPTFRA
jgi:predicted ATPase